MDNGIWSVGTSVRLADQEGRSWYRPGRGDLNEAIRYRHLLTSPVDEVLGESTTFVIERNMDALCTKVLGLRATSDRWREAASTALLGSWCEGKRPGTNETFAFIAVLRAEVRTLNRQLVPLWRNGPRSGRVLSLDADLGGMCLYDLVAVDVDLLNRAAGGVFEDERLNKVLRALEPDERRTVLALAFGEGTTWAEASAVIGADNPETFGERVRRKARRLAAEQQRRAEHRVGRRSKGIR
ncbi:hypothetical protein AB9Q10_23155 [Streptomyces krungchingensis]|uniref:hypothetical protein n=1 Tax=Streptomyces krungchingensis TaxID=1565034 RepID=UPI003CEBF1CE